MSRSQTLRDLAAGIVGAAIVPTTYAALSKAAAVRDQRRRAQEAADRREALSWLPHNPGECQACAAALTWIQYLRQAGTPVWIHPHVRHDQHEQAGGLNR